MVCLAAEWEKPWFCHELDCPIYSVISHNDNYTIREYKAAKWVSTKVQSVDFRIATTKGFWRLMNYISGNNVQKKTVEMATPVHFQFESSRSKFVYSNLTMSFYLPYEYQEGEIMIPDPIPGGNVAIVNLPQTKVAVLEFGGFVLTEKDIEARMQRLRSHLEFDGLDYAKESVMVTQYDPPFRFKNRHNEIWIKLQ